MTLKPPATWRAVATLLASLVLVQADRVGAAEENEATQNRIVELNKKALVAYDALDMETASALLHQALNLCKREGSDNSVSIEDRQIADDLLKAPAAAPGK